MLKQPLLLFLYSFFSVNGTPSSFMPVGNLGLVKPCQVSLLLSSWTFPVLFISTTVAMGQMHIVSFLGTVNAFFFKDVFIFLFIFRQRGRKREREGEKHQCVVACHTPPTGGLSHNPGMCPDWESNQWPFASQSGAQSIEAHQPGLK